MAQDQVRLNIMFASVSLIATATARNDLKSCLRLVSMIKDIVLRLPWRDCVDLGPPAR